VIRLSGAALSGKTTTLALFTARATLPQPGTHNYFTEMCSGSEAGSYLRLIDFCITQL